MNNGICSWCKKAWGSTTHCLIFCDVLKKAWKDSIFWDEIKGLRHLSIEDLCRTLYARLGEDGLGSWIMRLWSLWSFLCNVKHGDKQGNACDSMRGGDSMLNHYQKARQRLAVTSCLLPVEGSRLWKPPRQGVIRLDIDVSFHERGQLVGVGFIFRDHMGQIVAAVSRRIGFTPTVLLGELHAMLLGIGFCFENDIGPVVVYTDSLLAIHILHDTYGGSDSLSDDLFEAFSHAKQHVVLDFCHARREANLAAHSLANLAISSPDVMIW